MADAPTEPATGTDPTTPVSDDADDLGDKGKNALTALRAELRAAKAEIGTLKPLADKAQALEDANKSEAQRAAEALATAQAEAEAAKSSALRYEIAATKGVKPEDLDLLVGSSREEIEAKADRVIALYGESGQPRPPKPNAVQGTGGNRPANASPRDEFASFLGAALGGAKS